MNYSDVLKRAWTVTWRYKILWLFGLFAGAASYSFNGSSSRSGDTSYNGTGTEFRALERALAPYLWALVALAVVFIAVAIVWWILSIAATGGLIHLVNEAEDGRPVRARDGWRVGFQKWGRVFLQMLVIGLPMLALILLLTVVVLVSVFGAGAGAAAKSPAAVISAIGGMCFVLVLFIVVAVPLSVVLAVIGQLGLRYGVIDDVPAVQALKRGWADLRGKRGAFVMFLIMWGVGIGYGIAAAVVMLFTIVPAVFMFIARQYAVAVLLVLLGVAILIVPNAVFAAFSSAAWTVFFRKMTGRTPIGGAVSASASPSGVGPGLPPPPPGAWSEGGAGGAGDAPGADPWKAANEVPPVPEPPRDTPLPPPGTE
jgi:hypothetical protein